MQSRYGIGCYLHSIANFFNISKISNNSTDIILFRSYFRIFYVVRELGYPHRQLRGLRREEHTAAHVLCLFEPVRRVTQNMSKKACETNRKRSMSVGIAVDSSVKGMMRSKFPTIIPSFLVLSIPMNLPKSRKRVRQRAPRFREFHLHSPKRNFS